jgi:hypothetical protein
MMLRYFLDTGIVSVPVWKEPDPRVVGWFNAAGPECAVAAPVWHELIYGSIRPEVEVAELAGARLSGDSAVFAMACRPSLLDEGRRSVFKRSAALQENC